MELYKTIEKSGMVYTVGAYNENALVGFMTVMSPVNPHHGEIIAVVESIFVGKAYRSTGAGLKLIRAAEMRMKEVKAAGLFFSAPIDSDLSELLPKIGYVLTNQVFFKKPVSNELIESMKDAAIAKVYKLEEYSKKMPQVEIKTSHTLHNGVYTRTIMIPAGVMLTGALVKIDTTLIISGNVIVYAGDQSREIDGYLPILAAANRKQAFIAKKDTYITMIFRTEADSVEEAEEEFTDETHLLMSRNEGAPNDVITEAKCLAQ